MKTVRNDCVDAQTVSSHFSIGRDKQVSRFGRAPRISGFTLIEMLIVVTILLVLAGLTTAAIHRVLASAARQDAASRCQAVVLAIKNYKSEYYKWPGQVAQGEDGSIDQDVIMAELMNNPRGNFLASVKPHWLNKMGELIDPWMQRCLIVMDENDDGIVQVNGSLDAGYPIVTNIPNAAVVVISWGSDPANGQNMIIRWREQA